jgi:trehalose synthase
MWKRAALMGSCAVGIRQQIRPGLDGVLVRHPEALEEIAETLDALLPDQAKREVLGRSARQRVHDNFLVFTQVKSWLELLTNTIADRWPKS